MGKRTWTEEEERRLEDMYKDGLSLKEIAKRLNKSYGSITDKTVRMKLGDKYTRKNNPKFKAPYQDYDWCYDKIINKNMTCSEIAKEYGYSIRVIEKWAREIHKLSNRTYRYLKHPNAKQMELMMFGTIGDGHIDKRPEQPVYIESHAEDEKDYLFWKYKIISDLCLSEPKYHPPYVKYFNGKPYDCKSSYRMETRIIMDLDKIRKMSKFDIIKKLNEFGLSLHLLDDGSRSDLWQICLAEWTIDEKELYIDICKNRFGLNCYPNKDNRYVYFDADSSRKIDKIILYNIPNNLDIIYKKILNNDKITKPANYIYVIHNDKKQGLSSYCREHKIRYDEAKQKINELKLKEINEDDFLNLMEVA